MNIRYFTIWRGEVYRQYKSIKMAKKFCPGMKIVEVDIDELMPAAPKPQESMEYHERQMLRHAELADGIKKTLV